MNKKSETRQSKIVNYWNSSLLYSYESSTSHADYDLAILDNIIENKVLNKILMVTKQNKLTRCLDIGAGYGRFLPTFEKFFSEIVLLEAAEKIYIDLKDRVKDNQNTECVLSEFEDFEDSRKYDLIFASGILYLYENDMVYHFFEKSKSMLAEKGFFILRDFIAQPPIVSESRYVDGAFCNYRKSKFWVDMASSHGFELLEIKRSKPCLIFLRNAYAMRLLRFFRISNMITRSFSINAAMKFGKWDLNNNKVQTVFIVMRMR